MKKRQPNLPDTTSFRPSDFMRARRPEHFSDSETVIESRLTRELLEYHLETLTNRKQETEFEYFARRLAEKEICPNLIPQTGPTGGGDSKTDTETYPVSDVVAELWYQGIGQEARNERWGFAFSAKKDWKSKVQDDVKKIAATDRGYKHIFFITNQFVRDKARAESEDELTRQYNIPVRILDRSWILDKVFTNNRQALTIESLHLTNFAGEAKRKVGPCDVAREAELRELDVEIADPDRYQGVEYQLAEDCLRSAMLARGLELPRVEVDGRFARTERVAERVGLTQQRLRIAYTKAWTAFWWHDDFEEFNRIYTEVEHFAEGSSQANDIELVVNLWHCLSATVGRGQLDAAATDLIGRTTKLKAELDRLASDTNRPNNALQARTNNLFVELNEAVAQRDDAAVNEVLKGFMGVFEAAASLGAFPVEPLEKIIRELGDLLPDNPTYDDLFEQLVDFLEKRRSEGEGGYALLARGYQKLKAEKYYDAIRLLGRAQEKLIKHEYRNELASALAGCGVAYKAVGLLWAARTCTLAGVTQLLGEFLEDGNISTRALSYVQNLIWFELQLGRVPCILCWMDLASALALHLRLEGERKEYFEKQRETQDMILGILMLRTPLEELSKLEFMPQTLEKRQLPYSYMALLYALGYETFLHDEGWIPQDESPDSVRTFFEQWINQPAKDDLPEQPALLSGTSTTLRSCILGSEILVDAASDLSSIQLAETILGALEALLATSADQTGLFPYRQELRLNIRPSDHDKEGPWFQIKEHEGEPVIEIRHPPQFSPTTVEARTKQKDWVLELIASVLPQLVIVRDRKYIEHLAKEESVFSRTLSFSEIAVCISNVLGDTPKLLLSDWEKEPSTEEFPLLRTEPWFAHLQKDAEEKDSTSMWSKLGEGPPPPELLHKMRTAKHGEHNVVSLIDIPLWDKAKWRATAFMYTLDDRTPPVLGICFQDGAVGQTIFQALRKRLGKSNAAEGLRISIITGIDRSNPFAYAVVLGSNPKIEDSKKGFLIMVSRINRMQPRDPRNLTGFLESYHRAGRYLVVPAAFSNAQEPPQFFVHLAIGKTELHVRPAWLIGENDPDLCVLHADDTPLIPDGETDPPVLRALDWIRSRRGKTLT